MSNQNQLQTTSRQAPQLAKQNQNYLTEFIRSKDEAELVECMTGVKLSEISRQEAETLIEIVGKWGFYLGISQKLNSDDILLICKFIKDTYPNLTISELNKAMSLYLKGEFGKIDFFGQLSPLFISTLLNAYVSYKKDNLRDLYARSEFKTPDMPTPKMTPKEEHQMIVDAILYEYEKYKNGKNVDDFFSIIYDFLKKTNRIETSETLLKDAEAHALNCLERDKYKTSSTIGDVLKKSLAQGNESEKEKYSKNYIVMDLFSKIKDINQYVSNIKVEEIE